MEDQSTKYFLVGMMGSGKSTIGKILSSKWGVRFVDMDEEIEALEGCSVSEIFERFGEGYFRSLEHQLLEKFLLDGLGFILATGGGVGANEALMTEMKKAGTVIFLDVNIETVLSRMSMKDINRRPLLTQVEDVASTWEELSLKRLPVYRMADFSIDTCGKSNEDIIFEIEQNIHTRDNV